MSGTALEARPVAAPKAYRAHAVEGTLISHSWAHSCQLRAMQGRAVPGVKKAHFSREEERKWLLLPGPSRYRVYGTLLLSVLPHSGEGGSARWGLGLYRLLAAEPGSRN